MGIGFQNKRRKETKEGFASDVRKKVTNPAAFFSKKQNNESGYSFALETFTRKHYNALNILAVFVILHYLAITKKIALQKSM